MDSTWNDTQYNIYRERNPTFHSLVWGLQQKNEYNLTRGNWDKPERAQHRRYSWEISHIIIIIIIMVRLSLTRRGWSHEVCRASGTSRGSQYTARRFRC